MEQVIDEVVSESSENSVDSITQGEGNLTMAELASSLMQKRQGEEVETTEEESEPVEEATEEEESEEQSVEPDESEESEPPVQSSENVLSQKVRYRLGYIIRGRGKAPCQAIERICDQTLW